jgi:hypothetical protein
MLLNINNLLNFSMLKNTKKKDSGAFVSAHRIFKKNFKSIHLRSDFIGFLTLIRNLLIHPFFS